ncbi:hypothetical protein PRIPAC_81800 [Pristionchus pacificus]|uniref:Uncharacterized protein n=1 Tax=Pristionchus pacificus TaxID=54126 RepID=A0A2A6BHT5_PRIPA|nr:hypothetical protein PRIPAC_81800 [Pristionchus pacificus]|eukprot:PDM65470.1 hypothetical protein PRIPAC_52412 [Pristionchus pacificus]
MMMRLLPAFPRLLLPTLMVLVMAAAIAQGESPPVPPVPPLPSSPYKMPVIPMFDLAKYWKCYTDLWSNPMQAFTDPMKVWNTMMCGWVTDGSTPDKPTAPEAAPKAETPKQGRQGSGPINISPEAALALTMFRREYQLQNGDQGASSNTVNRWPLPGQFSYIPDVPTYKSSPFVQAGAPTELGGAGGGMFSPLVSQPFFYVMPVRGRKVDDSSEEEKGDDDDKDESIKPRLPSVYPPPIVITSRPFPPPFGGTGGRVQFNQFPMLPRPQGVHQGGRPRSSHHNIIVNQAGDGQQTLITRGGGYGSSDSISVIQR